MAQNISFALGGTASWADDDEVEIQSLHLSPSITESEVLHPVEEDIHHNQPNSGRLRSNEDYHRASASRGGFLGGDAGRHDRRSGSSCKNPVPEVGPWQLFVGNLSYCVMEDELADFIGTAGIKEIRLPRDFNNRTKGFAYVEFFEKENLLQAMELDNKELRGRRVNIDVAQCKSRDNGWYNKRKHMPFSERDDGHRARTPLILKPPSTSSEKTERDTSKASIFGDAKPRDEVDFIKRTNARDQERKPKAKVHKESILEPREETAVQPPRGVYKEKARCGPSRTHPRARDGGRGGDHVFLSKRNTSISSAPKAEPRQKGTKPRLMKSSEPSPAKKMVNLFDLLNDSDSD